jgi:hypothetical protein
LIGSRAEHWPAGGCLIRDPQSDIDRLVVHVTLAGCEATQGLQLDLHFRNEPIALAAVAARLQLPERVLRFRKHREALSRHQAERHSIVEPRVPQVRHHRQRVEECIVADQRAGHHPRRTWRRGRPNSHALKIPSVGGEREAVSRFHQMAAQVLHERQLTLALLAHGRLGLGTERRPRTDDGDSCEARPHGRYTTADRGLPNH